MKRHSLQYLLIFITILYSVISHCGMVGADANTDAMMARIAELNLQKRLGNLAKFRELYVTTTGFDPPSQASVCAGGVGVCLVASKSIKSGEKLATVENILIDREVVKNSFLSKVASSALSDRGALAAFLLHSRGEHASISPVHKAYVNSLPIEVDSMSRWKATELAELQDGGEVEAQVDRASHPILQI